MDFWRIVAGGAFAVVLEAVFLFQNRSNTAKVNHLDPRIRVRKLEGPIKHYILQLQVKVKKSFQVNVSDPQQNLGEDGVANFFTEGSHCDHVK